MFLLIIIFLKFPLKIFFSHFFNQNSEKAMEEYTPTAFHYFNDVEKESERERIERTERVNNGGDEHLVKCSKCGKTFNEGLFTRSTVKDLLIIGSYDCFEANYEEEMNIPQEMNVVPVPKKTETYPYIYEFVQILLQKEKKYPGNYLSETNMTSMLRYRIIDFIIAVGLLQQETKATYMAIEIFDKYMSIVKNYDPFVHIYLMLLLTSVVINYRNWQWGVFK